MFKSLYDETLLVESIPFRFKAIIFWVVPITIFLFQPILNFVWVNQNQNYINFENWVLSSPPIIGISD